MTPTLDEIHAKAEELRALIEAAGAPCATYDLSVARGRCRDLALWHLTSVLHHARDALAL